MDTNIEKLTKEIEYLKYKLSQLEKAYESEIISLSQYESIKADTNKKIVSLTEQLEKFNKLKNLDYNSLTDNQKEKVGLLDDLAKQGIFSQDEYNDKMTKLLLSFMEENKTVQAQPQQPVVVEEETVEPEEIEKHEVENTIEEVEKIVIKQQPETEEKIAEEASTIPSLQVRVKKLLLTIGAVAAVAVVCVVLALLLGKGADADYKKAVKEFEKGNYQVALNLFENLEDQETVQTYIAECHQHLAQEIYSQAKSLYESGKYEEAAKEFKKVSGYIDCSKELAECTQVLLDKAYSEAKDLVAQEKYRDAVDTIKAFYFDENSGVDSTLLGKYFNSIKGDIYFQAVKLVENNKLEQAKEVFTIISDYSDSASYISKIESGYKYFGKVINLGKNADLSNGDGTRVYILVANHRIRKTPSINGAQAGYCQQYASYPIYSVVTADGYTWYEIGENMWTAAQEGTWTTKY